MKILINGEAVVVEESGDLSISQLLELRGVAVKALAVELNGEVVPRDQHGDTWIREGDAIEIVSLVGGG